MPNTPVVKPGVLEFTCMGRKSFQEPPLGSKGWFGFWPYAKLYCGVTAVRLTAWACAPGTAICAGAGGGWLDAPPCATAVTAHRAILTRASSISLGSTFVRDTIHSVHQESAAVNYA